MIALFFLFLTLSVSPFKSKSRLEAENAALRHQLIVLQRRVRATPSFGPEKLPDKNAAEVHCPRSVSAGRISRRA